MRVLCLFGITVLTSSCAVTPLPKDTITIQEIISRCHYSKRSDCNAFDNKKVILSAEIYYPKNEDDEFDSRPYLYPIGQNIPQHDNDELWDEDASHDYIILDTDGLQKWKKEDISRHHLQTVTISGTAQSDCVKKGLWKHMLDDHIIIVGPCLSIGTVYLTDYTITRKENSK